MSIGKRPALYDVIQSDSGSAEACQALIERHRPDAATLVDFGCGTGDMRTVRLWRRVEAVTCLGNSLAYVHDNDDISRVFNTFAAHARPGALLVLCSPVSPVIRPEPTSAVVETPDGPAKVTIGYEWDLRTQINTRHRHWMLASGDEAGDEIRRRVLFPRELERYASGAGFEIVDMVGESGSGLIGPIAHTVARCTQ
ncbi:SAM-dependent methyltransferase [Streptomyces sp. NPDC002730]|uniref:SAM-dependent methyltransferase n=1 Tax=Streptomyces sp. NPDC002730 TaxID=3364662 RepID=UPI003697D742